MSGVEWFLARVHALALMTPDRSDDYTAGRRDALRNALELAEEADLH